MWATNLGVGNLAATVAPSHIGLPLEYICAVEWTQRLFSWDNNTLGWAQLPIVGWS